MVVESSYITKIFSKSPDLLRKGFLIGYFIPASLLILSTIIVGKISGLTPGVDVFKLLAGSDLLSISLISFFLSLIFLVSNRGIVRIVEGYGDINPVKIFGFIERWRYGRLKKLRTKLNRQRRLLIRKDRVVPDRFIFWFINSNQPESLAKLDLLCSESLELIEARRTKVLRELAQYFPKDESLLLPNSLANIIRAFEEYPYTMYGIDAIVSWGRLNGVIPEDYRNLIDDAQANLDFWINLIAVFFLITLESIGACLITDQPEHLIFCLIPILIMYVAYLGAKSSALQWGEFIKSAFDLFLPDLRKKLGMPEFKTDAEARAAWTRFSQAVLYVNPKVMPDRHTPQPDSQDPTRSA